MEPRSSTVKAHDRVRVRHRDCDEASLGPSKRIGSGCAKMGRVDHPNCTNPSFFRQAAGQLHCRITGSMTEAVVGIENGRT
jgi:hypothetical protein